MQRIRAALDYLSRTLDSRPDWAELQLVTDVPSNEVNRGIVDATHQSQEVTKLPLRELSRELTDADSLMERAGIAQWVAMAPTVQGGAHVLRGTRVPTEMMASWRRLKMEA